ncbi:MAG TPA: ABC transporter permease [Terriglobales bacterium]|nr:ABC transporter permease [Terriglobales bacterium]
MSGRRLFWRFRQWVSKQSWQLWAEQTGILARIELRRNFLARRGFWIYLLAFAPAAIVGLHALIDGPRRICTVSADTEVLAGIFNFYYLRLGIFFGCMGIFTWLFRGEIVERTLHYQFLVPVRREVLVLGKFLAGAITAILLFGISVLLSFYFMYVHLGPAGRSYVLDGPGLHQFWSYLLVTALACLGYGALFLALSLIFKNPIVPGALVMGYEAINPVLPSILQKLSIIFYLKQLLPVEIPTQGFLALFTVVAEPVTPFVSVLGLLCLTAAILIFACFRIHRLEVTYSTD